MSESLRNSGRVLALVKYFEGLVQQELRQPRKTINFKRPPPKNCASRRKISISQPNSPSIDSIVVNKPPKNSATLNMLLSPAAHTHKTRRPIKVMSAKPQQKLENEHHGVIVSASTSQSTADSQPLLSCPDPMPTLVSTPTTSSTHINSNCGTTPSLTEYSSVSSKPATQVTVADAPPQVTMVDAALPVHVSHNVEHTITPPNPKLQETTPCKQCSQLVPTKGNIGLEQSPIKTTPRRDIAVLKSPSRPRNSPRISEPVRSPSKTHRSPRPSEVPLLLPVDVSRIHIAEEILRSEETYSSLLDNLVKFFKEPIEAKWPEEAKILFNNIDSLAVISKELLEKLRQRLVNSLWTAEDNLSDIFLEILPQFNYYVPYCTEYPNALILLNKMKVENAEFAFKANRKVPPSGDLGDHLIMPVQRLPRYGLLLSDLLARTPPDHSDYAGLKQALEGIRDVNTKINEALRRKENQKRVLIIANSLVFPPEDEDDDLRALKFAGRKLAEELPAAARLFINEYFFTEVAFPDNGSLIEYPVRELRVSLFSDCILFSKPMDRLQCETHRGSLLANQNLPPVVTFQDDGKYEYVGCFELWKSYVLSLPKVPSFIFQFAAPTVSFLLASKSSDEVQRFQNEFDRTLKNLLEKDPKIKARRESIRVGKVPFSRLEEWDVVETAPQYSDRISAEELPQLTTDVTLKALQEFYEQNKEILSQKLATPSKTRKGIFGSVKNFLSPRKHRRGPNPTPKKRKENALTQADMLLEQLDRLQQKAVMLRVTTPQKSMSSQTTPQATATLSGGNGVAVSSTAINKKRPQSAMKKEGKENAVDNTRSINGPPSTTKVKRGKRRRLENISDTAKKLNLNKI